MLVYFVDACVRVRVRVCVNLVRVWQGTGDVCVCGCVGRNIARYSDSAGRWSQRAGRVEQTKQCFILGKDMQMGWYAYKYPSREVCMWVYFVVGEEKKQHDVCVLLFSA